MNQSADHSVNRINQWFTKRSARKQSIDPNADLSSQISLLAGGPTFLSAVALIFIK